jgi:hypothetical protein
VATVEVSKYTVYPDGYDQVPASDKYHWTLSVELRNPEKGLWAVSNGWGVYNRAGIEDGEPLPSNRDDEFLSQTRFPLQEALDLAESIVNVRKCNGYSFPMLIEKYRGVS